MQALVRDRNRAAILLFELLWGLAMPLVYYSTILPGYLRQLGIDNAWIGLAPALHTGTMAVVQPLSAYLIRPGTGRLVRMRLAYAVGACGYALLGLGVLRGFASPTLALAATLLVVFAFAVAVGIGDPQYMEVVVAAVPAALRGRYFGLRNVCLGLGGIAGGALADWLLRRAPAPTSFGACFLAGGALYVASTFSMAVYREQPAVAGASPTGLRRYLSERILPHIRQGDLRSYLIAVVFFSLAVSGFPFLSLLLRDRLHEGNRLLGLLGGLLMAANLSMSWLLGAVCDRWGPRRGFALSLLVYAAGVIGCIVFRDRALLLGAYFLAAIWMPAQFIAMTDLALRLAARSPAAEITAVMMATMAPARILGPVLVGAAIDRWSYTPPLVACAVCALISLACLGRRGRGRAPNLKSP